MKKEQKILLLLTLLLMPAMVFANDGDADSISMAIFVEAFVSIHMSVFVLKPLSELISKENAKKIFWLLFFIRVVFLLVCDFFVTPKVFMLDFFAVFVGAFIIIPIYAAKNGKRAAGVSPAASKNLPDEVKGIELRCAKCNAVLKITDKFCTKCGAPFDGNNVVVSENPDGKVNLKKERVLPSSFDSMYNLSEDKLLEHVINKEFSKAGVENTSKLIPEEILKRKRIFNIIFIVLLFIYICSIFIHFPVISYIIGFIILLVFFIVTRRYNVMKYIKKQVKARPNEKITNIVMNIKNTFVEDNSKWLFLVGILIAIVLPLIIFKDPVIIYEKVDGGYAVRYYAFGLTNFKTATIPETYKNEPVVSLRGNTFSNMFFLEKVTLPDTIKEIRGQAFLNCFILKEVNIPKNLEYLGGSAFANARSITSIELPDTLTYLGGQAFQRASKLEYVKLSENLTEIRGNTFENCHSLKSIVIPDKVTRIGGHAFYGDSSLSEVTFTANSQLKEIGSSAFRQCYDLHEIVIPNGVLINERAFKESPTIVHHFGEVNAVVSDDCYDTYNLNDCFSTY